jgi:hypothetical protein
MASVYGKERFVVNNKMERKYDLECPPFHSGHIIFSGKIIFYICVCRALRSAPNAFFTGRGCNGKQHLLTLQRKPLLAYFGKAVKANLLKTRKSAPALTLTR